MGFSKKKVIGDNERKRFQDWVGTEVGMPWGRVRNGSEELEVASVDSSQFVKGQKEGGGGGGG